MFTYLWERLSPPERRRALRSAIIVSIVAYLLLALVGEPLQSLRADLHATSSGVFTEEEM